MPGIRTDIGRWISRKGDCPKAFPYIATHSISKITQVLNVAERQDQRKTPTMCLLNPSRLFCFVHERWGPYFFIFPEEV